MKIAQPHQALLPIPVEPHKLFEVVGFLVLLALLSVYFCQFLVGLPVLRPDLDDLEPGLLISVLQRFIDLQQLGEVIVTDLILDSLYPIIKSLSIIPDLQIQFGKMIVYFPSLAVGQRRLQLLHVFCTEIVLSSKQLHITQVCVLVEWLEGEVSPVKGKGWLEGVVFGRQFCTVQKC